ncbi:cytochrome P450 [Robiginitomaculum antarcticum]|uniref:cytochrome P450 n=1 Tax=Robiginitomaculum antarcticum TaxID=437507 RepID=UPI0003634988|nr:cytochrome P450 [Robiginitomaculum antarcticum]
MTDLFIAPHAQPLKGTENLAYATWKFMRNPLEGFGPLSYRQGITSVKHLGTQMHIVTAPEGMNDILVKHTAKFTKSPIDARILGPATKEGLLSVHGKQWKMQRRAVAPIFRARHMADLSPLVHTVVDGFKSRLGAGRDVELNGAMADLTFDILAKALLGDPKGLDRDRLKKATRRVVTSAGTLRPDDLIPWPRGTPRPIGPRGYAALRRLKSAADHLINSRQSDAGDDLVGLLIGAQDPKTGQRLSRREQRDNLIGFFIAGHETTALTLTWALYLMAMDKGAQTRVRAEARAVGIDKISFETLDQLPFTRAVIDETMRLFPPAPIINRECHEACEVLGRAINPGDILLLCPYIMHRRDALWENALAFDPDRFIRNPDLRSKAAPFMPFGAGPRVCVGASFALMESVMGLASLMAEYDITVADDCFPRPLMTVTLRPEGGIKARLNRV